MSGRSFIGRARRGAPGFVGLAVASCLALLWWTAGCNSLPPRSAVEIVTGEWPPYTEQGTQGQGTLTELVSTAVTGMGYRPRYRFVPFYDAKELAREARVVGTFPWFEPTGGEEDWILVEPPLLEVEYVFFSRRDRLRQEGVDPELADSLADLDDVVLGGVEGYTYAPEVAAAIDHRFPSEQAAFHSLFDDGEGSVDVVQASREVGLQLVTGTFAGEDVEIVILDRGDLDTPPQPAYFLVNPEYPDAERFARELAAKLEELDRSGLLEVGEEAATRVRLTGSSGAPGVEAYAQRNDPEPTWIIPHGSPAVVVRWAPAHREAAAPTAGETVARRCRVRLLEEPGRGRLAWVEGRHVHREGTVP